jgi:molybdate transport system regulatory protein
MKLSARNHIETTITSIKEGLVNAEIDMELKGGQKLASIITLSSAERLGLEVGKTVYAVVKASNVLIGDFSGQISARNMITCKVSGIKKGKVNAEISLNAGEESLVSVITLESSENLGLEQGKSVYAVIKASDVIIGVSE